MHKQPATHQCHCFSRRCAKHAPVKTSSSPLTSPYANKEPQCITQPAPDCCSKPEVCSVPNLQRISPEMPQHDDYLLTSGSPSVHARIIILQHHESVHPSSSWTFCLECCKRGGHLKDTPALPGRTSKPPTSGADTSAATTSSSPARCTSAHLVAVMKQ